MLDRTITFDNFDMKLVLLAEDIVSIEDAKSHPMLKFPDGHQYRCLVTTRQGASYVVDFPVDGVSKVLKESRVEGNSRTIQYTLGTRDENGVFHEGLGLPTREMMENGLADHRRKSN